MTYEAWQAHNAANISEWLTTERLRAECGRLSEAGAPSPELLLAHAMRALESAAKDAALGRHVRQNLTECHGGWAISRAFIHGAPSLETIDDAIKEAP